jgi:hypothetical protein
MTRESLQQVGNVLLPAAVTRRTHAHLAEAGRAGLEGMALWAGAQDGETFQVRTCIIPQQQGHRTAHGLAVTVAGDELHRINLQLYREGLRLVAQIHSHPTEAYHSDVDDKYAMATALGAFSLVVPDFATGPFDVEAFAIYRLTPSPWWRFTPSPYWRALAPKAVRELFRVED